jgi:aspartate/methionine/tyrosine aminotransferase
VALRAGERVQGTQPRDHRREPAAVDAFFAGYGDLFDWTPPDGGCVAFPALSRDPTGAEAFCTELVETEGVLLLPASVYTASSQPYPPTAFRIGVGRRDPGPALAAFGRFLDARR